MSGPKHTPGPWVAEPMVMGAKGAFYIVGNREGNNAEVEVATVGPTLSPRAEANARLIAAAPELLEALEWALNFIENTESELGITLSTGNRARAAIAKARGEQA